jgi:hypothetical protein
VLAGNPVSVHLFVAGSPVSVHGQSGVSSSFRVIPGNPVSPGQSGVSSSFRVIPCQFIFSGKNNELTPDFPRVSSSFRARIMN